MKRKGLIVSSIVMVIVLIASLTTATYAWFTSTSNAEIKAMTVQTVASSGLSLSMLTYDTSNENLKYETSGNVFTDEEDSNYVKGDVSGSGTVLDFSNYFVIDEKTNQPKNGYYCASGNGIDMYSAYNYVVDPKGSATNPSGPDIHYGPVAKPDVSPAITEATLPAHVKENNGLGVNDTPVLLGKATRNSYFMVDIAVYNHAFDSSKPLLTLGNFSISATGPDVGLPIAAASRIAIFASDAAAAAPQKLPTMTKTNAVVAFEPFADVYTQGGLKTDSVLRDETKHIKTLTITHGTGTIAYNQKDQATALLSTTFADKLYRQNSKNTNFQQSITQSTTLDLSGVTLSATNYISLGAFTKENNVKHVRIVIWFEGEDAECATSLAKGGGIKFTCKFETDASI